MVCPGRAEQGYPKCVTSKHRTHGRSQTRRCGRDTGRGRCGPTSRGVTVVRGARAACGRSERAASLQEAPKNNPADRSARAGWPSSDASDQVSKDPLVPCGRSRAVLQRSLRQRRRVRRRWLPPVAATASVAEHVTSARSVPRRPASGWQGPLPLRQRQRPGTDQPAPLPRSRTSGPARCGRGSCRSPSVHPADRCR